MSLRNRRRRIRRSRALLGVLAVLAGCVSGARGADDTSAGLEADFQYRSTASASLAAGGGALSQSYGSLDLTVPLAGSNANGLDADLIAERLQFYFRNFGQFLPGRSSPLADASLFTLQPNLILTPAPQWSLLGSGLVQYAGADGASSSAATLWGGSAAAAYQASPGLKLGVGVELEQRMKASALVLPFPVIDWKISDRWSLTSLDGESGRLACALSGAWSLFGQLEFQSQDLRLRRSSSIASGIVRYEAYPLSLGVQWKPQPRLTVSLSAGAAVDQTYRFEDAHGRLLGAGAAHAPPIGTVEVDGTF